MARETKEKASAEAFGRAFTFLAAKRIASLTVTTPSESFLSFIIDKGIERVIPSMRTLTGSRLTRFCVTRLLQPLEQWIEVAVEDCGNVMEILLDPVVSDAILRNIVRADFL